VLRIMNAPATAVNGRENWALPLPQQPPMQPAVMPFPVPVADPSAGSVMPARQPTWNLAFVAASVLLFIAIVAFAITFLKL